MKNIYKLLLVLPLFLMGCKTGNIRFKCEKVEEICLENWDLDRNGKLSKKEAATVRSIGNVFAETDISSFNEFKYFTGITAIEERAFYYCSSLASITIPDSVTSIGDYAFEYCSSLASVTIGNGVTEIGHGAFSGCSSLTSVTIPDGVTSIGSRAFFGCKSLAEFSGKFASEDGRCLIVNGKLKAFAPAGLTEYTIPDSVTEIGHGAFSGCSSLASVTIGNGVTEIEWVAFEDCSSLAEVHISDIAAWCKIEFNSYSSNPLYYAHNLYLNDELVTDLVIPDGVTSIGDRAFYGCSSLASITIPDSVTSIGEYAFENCSSLTSVTIPDSVTSIGNDAFEDCSSLASITIPDSVTSIGDSAFYYCSSLTSVTIGNGVTEIGHWAFSGCSSLTSVTIPDGVTSIRHYAFYKCSSLTSITIPDSVTSIGMYAFEDCSKLASVYCKPTTPPSLSSGSPVFANNASTLKIYVPKNNVDAYKSATTWKTFTIEGYDFE